MFVDKNNAGNELTRQTRKKQSTEQAPVLGSKFVAMKPC